ncbi:protein of unknown function [Burkholderia multivorans]
MMRSRGLSGPPRRSDCSHNFCSRPAALRPQLKAMMHTGEPCTAHSTSANAAARAMIFKANKNVGPSNPQELHPRFRDAIPTPL